MNSGLRAEEVFVRRGSIAILVSVLPAMGAGAVWYAWLGHECTVTHGSLTTFALAVAIVGGAVVLANRLRAWQTNPGRRSLGIDIAVFWLALTCIVLATILSGAAHHCFE